MEARGDRPDASEAIKQYRESGNTTKLLGVLIQEEARHRQEQTFHRGERIKLNREIAAVAFLKGDIERAKQAIVSILQMDPNDLFAINQRGHIYSLRGRLQEAESDYLRILELRGRW